jgi:hypothetical protein
LHLEEAMWQNKRRDESLLKDLITGPTIEINDKYVPVYSVPNHLHVFVTGNPEWLVSAGFKARRIFALHADDAHRNDTEYFAGLDKWFKNGGAQALMYYYKNHKSEIDLRKVPVTDELIVQKQQSMSPVQEWWDSILETKEMPYGELNEVTGRVQVIKKALYLDFITSSAGRRSSIIPEKFAHQFLALLPVVVGEVEQINERGRRAQTAVITENVKLRDGRGVRRDGYEIPNCDECRALLEFRLGGKKIWNSDNGSWTVLKKNIDFDFPMYKDKDKMDDVLNGKSNL